MSQANPEGLTSWKGIADHLGVNVRTAQRWEEERGLPVRRLGGQRGRVVASTDELDAWKRATSHKPSWWNNLRIVRMWALSVTLPVAVALTVAFLWLLALPQAGTPASFLLVGADLIVTDHKGRRLWRRTLASRPDASAYLPANHRNRVWFGKLGREETSSVLFGLQPESALGGRPALQCYSQTGSLRWEFQPGRRARFQDTEYPLQYRLRAFRVLSSPVGDGRTWIAVNSVHVSQPASQVAVLDHEGNILHEYWHAGVMEAMETEDLDRDGFPEILLAGGDHPSRQAAVVVLDTRRMLGGATRPPEAVVDLSAMGPGSAGAVVVFPRTSLNRKFEQSHRARSVRVVDAWIMVQVSEQAADPDPYLLYTLDRGLQVVNVEVSVSLLNRYGDLKGAGLLEDELAPASLEKLRRGVRVLRY